MTRDFFDPTPEQQNVVLIDAATHACEDTNRETVLFTVSREVAQAAITQVLSCEGCNPDEAE
jgi:hypothetical protein